MTQSNFELVAEFHRLFDHVINDKPTPAVFNNEALCNLRIALIEEELNELKKAIAEKDIVETADAFLDILYVTLGGLHTWGIPIQHFDLVHESNMTKACKTEQEAIETVEFHRGKGVANPQYKKANGDYYIVFNGDTGKILKSKYYKAVDLKFLSQE